MTTVLEEAPQDSPERPTGTETRTTTTLAVSRNGNGVGIVVVKVPAGPSGEDDATVVIHILPKVWLSGGPADKQTSAAAESDGMEDEPNRLAFDLRSRLKPRDGRPVQIVLHETDRIVVPREFGERLLTAKQVTIGGDPNAPLKRFFRLDPDAKVAAYTDPSEPDQITDLWQLIDELVGDDAASAFGEDPELLAAVAPHLHALEPILRKAFLNQVERALRVRRANFVSFTADTLFVRGRMESRALLERQARRRLPVTCTFDDLSHDTPVWQVVRAATRLVAADPSPDIGTRAAHLDSRLADVSIVGVSTAIGLLNKVGYSKEARALRSLLALARSVLLFQYPAGGLASAASNSHAVTLKVDTATLWERLLAELLDADDRIEKQELGDANVRLFSKIDEEKRPDIIRMSGGRTIVVDAKYKRQDPDRPPTLTTLGMQDQYQCFAYASLLQARTAFVTVRTQGVERHRWLAKEHADHVRVPAGQEGVGPAVAVIPVRFPMPGQSVDHWRASEGADLVEWLTATGAI